MKLKPIIIDGEACCPHCQSLRLSFRQDVLAFGVLLVGGSTEQPTFESIDMEPDWSYADKPHLWCLDCDAILDETCVN